VEATRKQNKNSTQLKKKNKASKSGITQEVEGKRGKEWDR
jgi:hypothetical protein